MVDPATTVPESGRMLRAARNAAGCADGTRSRTISAAIARSLDIGRREQLEPRATVDGDGAGCGDWTGTRNDDVRSERVQAAELL